MATNLTPPLPSSLLVSVRTGGGLREGTAEIKGEENLFVYFLSRQTKGQQTNRGTAKQTLQLGSHPLILSSSASHRPLPFFLSCFLSQGLAAIVGASFATCLHVRLTCLLLCRHGAPSPHHMRPLSPPPPPTALCRPMTARQTFGRNKKTRRPAT